MKFGLTRQRLKSLQQLLWPSLCKWGNLDTGRDGVTCLGSHRSRANISTRVCLFKSCVLKSCASVTGQIKNSSHIFTKISKVRVCLLSLFSRVRHCEPMDCSLPGSSSMGFSRQEYWSGLQALLQGIFPTQGSNSHHLRLLHWQASSLPQVPPGKPQAKYVHTHILCKNLQILMPVLNSTDGSLATNITGPFLLLVVVFHTAFRITPTILKQTKNYWKANVKTKRQIL